MALLLWVAGILAFVSDTPELGWAIWAVIWINAIFSFSQEFQAEKAGTRIIFRSDRTLGISPIIWRRILVTSNSTIVDLHYMRSEKGILFAASKVSSITDTASRP